MSIQHFKMLSDPKKISFEKFEMKEKCMGVQARTPFFGAKVHGVQARTPV